MRSTQLQNPNILQPDGFLFISDSASKSCAPSRNCLDLYEEILTEEGTAKEATYNDVMDCHNY